MNREWVQLAIELRAVGYSWVRIAEVFRQRYGMPALVAMRRAHAWSQQDAADAWNRLWPDEPRMAKVFSAWENWRPGRPHQLNLQILDRLARIYGCRVADLLVDQGDYRCNGREVAVNPAVDQAAASAFARARALEREILVRWPDQWARLDKARLHPAAQWPPWCLLPSHVAATVIGWAPTGPAPVTAISALYAWQFTRSVHVYEPKVAARVMRRPPDDLTELEPLTVLPDWCLYVAGGHRQWPGAGMWAHLDADHHTGRPVLRLLVDLGEGGIDALVPIPVQLDKPVIEAVAEDRGLPLDHRAARLAEVVDRLIALVTYPGHTDAEVYAATGGRRRAFARHPATDQTVWAVGYEV